MMRKEKRERSCAHAVQDRAGVRTVAGANTWNRGWGVTTRVIPIAAAIGVASVLTEICTKVPDGAHGVRAWEKSSSLVNP